jgi:hypothetical protein
MYHNVEKSVFRRGEYVGYGQGDVWHIRKSKSLYAKWVAWPQNDPTRRPLYGARLRDISEKLADKTKA